MENHSLNMILGIEGYKYLTAEKVGTIPSIAEQILEMIKEQPSTENSSFNSENVPEVTENETEELIPDLSDKAVKHPMNDRMPAKYA